MEYRVFDFKLGIMLFVFPAVEKIPYHRGGMGYEACRGSGSSTAGATHDGPHSHPGERSVYAGPPISEKPFQHCAAVHHLCKGPVTFEPQVEKK